MMSTIHSLHHPKQKKLLNKFLHKLSSEEQEIFTEIVRIQREIEPMYGY